MCTCHQSVNIVSLREGKSATGVKTIILYAVCLLTICLSTKSIMKDYSSKYHQPEHRKRYSQIDSYYGQSDTSTVHTDGIHTNGIHTDDVHTNGTNADDFQADDFALMIF